MSTPSSATGTSAVRWFTPWTVSRRGKLVGEGGHGDVDLPTDRVDGFVEVINVGQELTDEEGVMGADAASERLAQGGQLPTQPAAGQIGEDRRIGGARDWARGRRHGAPGLRPATNQVRRARPAD